MLTVQQKQNNQDFLDKARRTMRRLLMSHPTGLGIDDVRRHCETIGIKPSNPTLWGAVVRDKGFKRSGDKQSSSTTTHGRWINTWKLR